LPPRHPVMLSRRYHHFVAVTARARHEELGLSLEDVKAMFRYMLMTRMVSERILQLNRMGRTPFGAGTDGHEAAQIGAAWNIRRGKDWLVPYYRDMGVAFVCGVTPLEEFRMVLANSTRFEWQMATKNVADKASAYAMPGFIADGMDVLESYAKTKEAVAITRSGGGPTLVELKCYRFQPHTSDDDDSRYRNKEEVREWMAKDPV